MHLTNPLGPTIVMSSRLINFLRSHIFLFLVKWETKSGDKIKIKIKQKIVQSIHIFFKETQSKEKLFLILTFLLIILLFYLINLFRSLVCFEKVVFVIYKLYNGDETWRNLNDLLLISLKGNIVQQFRSMQASIALFKLNKEAWSR